ncbi:MAG: bifunctional transaldolase/phosoglucose isomerase, partial [Candidatus Aminicenantales bacterium]
MRSIAEAFGGQSVWLDYIRRSLISSGEWERMVKEDGFSGIIWNAAVLQKTLAGSRDYDEALRQVLSATPRADPAHLLAHLVTEDSLLAAEILRPVYEASEGKDGYVSLGLSPSSARDAKALLHEAYRAKKEMDCPNIMIEIPGTPEGLAAVEELAAEGTPVNITHLYSVIQYKKAAQAYLKGLKKSASPEKTAAVASFPLARLEVAVHRILEAKDIPESDGMKGRMAMACAAMVHASFRELFSHAGNTDLGPVRARGLRPLWSETGVREPRGSGASEIEDLRGEGTVIALSPVTWLAVRDRAHQGAGLSRRFEEAKSILERLEGSGIRLSEVGQELQEASLKAFAATHTSLLKTLEEKKRALLEGQKEHISLSLGAHGKAVERRVEAWESEKFSRRMWAKDPTLWFPEPVPEVADRLGWLALPELMHTRLESLLDFAEAIRNEGFSQVVLLGMGGSSLAPEVFEKTFGHAPGSPSLSVLDSTHPLAITETETHLALEKTLFLVSSKSGTTLETLSLFRYFWERTAAVDRHPGRHFCAVSDPGSPLARLAEERHFRKIFYGHPEVGGRYSALSNFGLIPAALTGVDIPKLIESAGVAAENCAFCVAEKEASGLVLGAALGELAASRDKLTLLTSASLSAFPDWLEQLIAESTGKNGKGIIPVAGEEPVFPEIYGSDRVFVYFFLEGDPSESLEKHCRAVREAGHPVFRFDLAEKTALGQEIFRWEVAVASAAAVLGIHPFNQPDVQLAKTLAQKAIDTAQKKGAIREEEFSIEEPRVLEQGLREWLGALRDSDYIAIQAYLAPSPPVNEALKKIRHSLLIETRAATTLGYGPRFLHSTGQLHKGGPDSVAVLQIVDDPEPEVLVPEMDVSFGD